MPPNEAESGAGFEVLPWHHPVWERWQQARRRGHLHHALLITGTAGTGKAWFADMLARSMLCGNPGESGMPCGECRDCRWLRAGNHPDYRTLQPDADSKSGEIKIDAVRELAGGEALSAQSGGYKITLISPAERMNRYAANALLKTLEEPVASSLFVLISARPAALPATVRSRCQRLHLPLPDEALALNWLKPRCPEGSDDLLALRLANGAPLAALRLLSSDMLPRREDLLREFLQLGRGAINPVPCAAAWMKLDLPLLFEWMGTWVADILRLGAGQGEARLNNPDHAAALAEQATRLDAAALHRFWQRLVEARGQLDGSNLNPQLLLENLLTHWYDIGVHQPHGRT